MGGGGSKCPECPPCANNSPTSKPPSSQPPPPKIIESANMCPNGQVIGKDGETNKCMPLTCQAGTTLTTDAKGTFGCTIPPFPGMPPSSTPNLPVICPYGMRPAFGACIPAVSPFEWIVTDTNNFCPKGYDMTSGGGGNPVCKISSDPNSGIGNVIKSCIIPQGGPLPYNTNNPDPNTVINPSDSIECPANSNIAVNSNCQLGCAVGSGPIKTCGPGQRVRLDASNNLICETVSPPTSSPATFTNVYDFKSKRDRNVENFSQNNNNKCKARY
jgi:hypothetical protein